MKRRSESAVTSVLRDPFTSINTPPPPPLHVACSFARGEIAFLNLYDCPWPYCHGKIISRPRSCDPRWPLMNTRTEPFPHGVPPQVTGSKQATELQAQTGINI